MWNKLSIIIKYATVSYLSFFEPLFFREKAAGINFLF